MTKKNPKRSTSEINAAIKQYEKASTLLARGFYEEAIDLFFQVIDRAFWLIPAYSGAGAASLEIGLFQQALDLATEGIRVLEKGPANPKKNVKEELTRQRSILVSQKASALSGLGQHRQAIDLAQETYENHPSAQTLIELGNTLAAAGKIHEAEEHFGLGLLETESPALAMIAYNNMAVLLERQCEFDAALKYFQRAFEINPNDSQATIELATALGERGHYEEACEILFSISPEDPNAERAMECELIIRQGEEQIEDDEDFITDLEKELVISPTALTYLNLALFYLQARQTITAITFLQKGLALEPDNLALITTLTDALLRKRLLEPAIPIVKEALMSHPDNPHLVSLQTLILARTHEFSNALHFFTTSIKLLGDKQTTFAEEPWVMSGPANRQLPSALKSYEYLVAAACHMKDWPLAIESGFAGLDLHLHHFPPPNSETDEIRLAVQKSKAGVLEQANFLTATSLEADPQSVAAIALGLHNLNVEYRYPPLDLIIESILPLVPEAEEILGQMLLIQAAFTPGQEDDE